MVWDAVTSEHGGRLVTHCGAQSVSRDEILMAPVPGATDSFKPLPHAEFIETIEGELTRRGVGIVSEHLALKQNGLQLFGLWDVTTVAPSGDFRSVIGFRNSNDKTWAAGVVAGSRVFVCDNLAFSGEFVCLNKKHTPNLNITLEIGPAIDRWEENFALLVGLSDHLKEFPVSDGFAKEIIFNIFAAEKFPMRLFPSVATNYFKPPHEEFEPRTAWSLMNAFTESAKAIKSYSTNQQSLLAVTHALREVSDFRLAA